MLFALRARLPTKEIITVKNEPRTVSLGQHELDRNKKEGKEQKKKKPRTFIDV